MKSYVPISDNKYVQYRLMADDWSIKPSDWISDLDIIKDVQRLDTESDGNSLNADGTIERKIEFSTPSGLHSSTVDKIYTDIRHGDIVRFKLLPVTGSINMATSFEFKLRNENSNQVKIVAATTDYVTVIADGDYNSAGIYFNAQTAGYFSLSVCIFRNNLQSINAKLGKEFPVQSYLYALRYKENAISVFDYSDGTRLRIIYHVAKDTKIKLNATYLKSVRSYNSIDDCYIFSNNYIQTFTPNYTYDDVEITVAEDCYLVISEKNASGEIISDEEKMAMLNDLSGQVVYPSLLFDEIESRTTIGGLEEFIPSDWYRETVGTGWGPNPEKHIGTSNYYWEDSTTRICTELIKADKWNSIKISSKNGFKYFLDEWDKNLTQRINTSGWKTEDGTYILDDNTYYISIRIAYVDDSTIIIDATTTDGCTYIVDTSRAIGNQVVENTNEISNIKCELKEVNADSLGVPLYNYDGLKPNFKSQFGVTALQTLPSWIGSQGCAVIDDYMIVGMAFDNNPNAKARVYNLQTNNLLGQISFDFGNYYKAHANTICFGVEKPNNSLFPALYLSQLDNTGLANRDSQYGVLVYSINDSFESTFLQAIIPDKTDQELMAAIGAGTPNYVVDVENGNLWVVGYKYASWVMVGNTQTFTKFKLPLLSEGNEIILTHDDILDFFELPMSPYTAVQETIFKNGRLYCQMGIDATVNQGLRIVNVEKHIIETNVNTTQIFSTEPQGIAIWNGNLIWYQSTANGILYKFNFY